MNAPSPTKPARLAWLTALILWLVGAPADSAETYIVPPDDIGLIGEIRYTKARYEDTLLDIARTFSIGQEEIVLANPGVDRWLPGEGAAVMLPTRYILPAAPRNGIVLNIAEMRLYYYPPRQGGRPPEVMTYPVSIGRMDWKTPLGTTRVMQKVKDPVWIPPESIRREHAEEGDILPAVVPAGPDNPLGRLALKLGIPGYLIHGTSEEKAYGIGMRVTHGCVRMYNEDIEALFPMVAVGTPVHIVDQPVKLGWFLDTLYAEIQPPIEEENLSDEDVSNLAMKLVERETAGKAVVVDVAALQQALREKRGIPVPISESPFP